MDLNGKKREELLDPLGSARTTTQPQGDQIRHRESLFHSFKLFGSGTLFKVSSFIISASKRNSLFPLPVLMGKSVYHRKGN